MRRTFVASLSRLQTFIKRTLSSPTLFPPLIKSHPLPLIKSCSTGMPFISFSVFTPSIFIPGVFNYGFFSPSLQTKTLSETNKSPVTCHQSPVTSHQSLVTSHLSPVTSHHLLVQVDVDNSGFLEFPEFCLMMYKKLSDADAVSLNYIIIGKTGFYERDKISGHSGIVLVALIEIYL